MEWCQKRNESCNVYPPWLGPLPRQPRAEIQSTFL